PATEPSSRVQNLAQATSCVVMNQATIMSDQTCACGNVVENYVGIPDLVIEDMWLDPPEVRAGEPVTLSVRIANWGTGMAWNPTNGGGFYTDVYVNLATRRMPDLFSCGFPGYGDIEPIVCNDPIPPGEARIFSQVYPDGLPLGAGQRFYVRADVHEANWFGLVPETDECNNLFPALNVHSSLLPLLLRRR
ncbi:MAG: hypothetical protein D6791_07475, partial [Chloroflexi bacterium]